MSLLRWTGFAWIGAFLCGAAVPASAVLIRHVAATYTKTQAALAPFHAGIAGPRQGLLADGAANGTALRHSARPADASGNGVASGVATLSGLRTQTAVFASPAGL